MVFSGKSDRMYSDAGSARTGEDKPYPILLFTALERFYGMDDRQMRAAFAEWLKMWIEEMYGIYPVPENKYKPYRRFTEYIGSNYATVKSWLTEHSFPDEKNILRLCEKRGDMELGQFWIQLQEINRKINKEEGIVVPEPGKRIESADELMELASTLTEAERARFVMMLVSKMGEALQKN